jgi:hypothetical protein
LFLSALALIVVALISLYQKINNKHFRKEFKKNVRMARGNFTK